MKSDERFTNTLRIAERVKEILNESGIDTLVIGAVALAVHQYPRATEDIDFAVAVPPAKLPQLDEEFTREGWIVETRMPDSADPLGGVIDIQAPNADLIQIVNFDNSPAGGFPRLVKEALATALPIPNTQLTVADLQSLIAFKLYSGGAKSKLDILELLDRNGTIDQEALANYCRSLGLDKDLDAVFKLADD